MRDKLTPPNPPLSDGVITLRPFRADDAAAITAACQDPAIQRWVPIIPNPYTEVDARGFILMTLQAWHDGSGYEFAMADATTDRYVGSIGLHLGANERRHAIGYLVAPEARGRGYATRACAWRHAGVSSSSASSGWPSGRCPATSHPRPSPRTPASVSSQWHATGRWIGTIGRSMRSCTR
jgi:GNAT superfamily N-acetyltransferase